MYLNSDTKLTAAARLGHESKDGNEKKKKKVHN